LDAWLNGELMSAESRGFRDRALMDKYDHVAVGARKRRINFDKTIALIEICIYNGKNDRAVPLA
jgi:hypothetical protein